MSVASHKVDEKNTKKSSYNDIIKLRRLKQFNQKKAIDFYMINYFLQSNHEGLKSMLFEYSDFNKQQVEAKSQLPNQKFHFTVKAVAYSVISACLMIKLKSILVVPTFWFTYCTLEKIIESSVRLVKKSMNNSGCLVKDCFFCNLNLKYEYNTLKYSYYLNLMDQNKERIFELEKMTGLNQQTAIQSLLIKLTQTVNSSTI